MADTSKDFFSETAAMRALPFSSSQRSDRSFAIGLWMVILFAAAEIFTASYYYLGRMRPAQAAARPSAISLTPPSAPPLQLASPVPAPPPPSVLAEPERLLQEAKALRQKGDITTALAKLQEASQRDPKNPTVLAELAKTYESIGLLDRSSETWRKLQEIGPSAGELYKMADLKLKTGVAGPAASPAESGISRAGADAIPDGSTFGITEIKATETPDPDADTNLMLRISVKKRENTVTDHTKVKIQVFFYDTVGDNPQPVLTNADVSYEWLTPNHDWTTTNPEVLAVTYVRAKNKVLSSEAALSAAAAAVKPGQKDRATKKPGPEGVSAEGGQRRYLGYIVCVYYHDQLQVVRANPTKLINLFPTPSSPSS